MDINAPPDSVTTLHIMRIADCYSKPICKMHSPPQFVTYPKWNLTYERRFVNREDNHFAQFAPTATESQGPNKHNNCWVHIKLQNYRMGAYET